MNGARRWGITLPLPGSALAAQREIITGLADLGYTDAWSAEVNGADAFTPLVLASQWAPKLRLGTAIAPVFTRGPGTLAMSAAALAGLAPGRFTLGVGTSSPAVVQAWNGISFTRPCQRAADTLEFLRAALSGEKITRRYPTFSVEGFRLESPPAVPPALALAALRPQMLALAGRQADAAITNWLSPGDVPKVAAAAGPGCPLVARIFVCPTADAEAARAIGRRMIAAYLTVPAYAAFHQWLGRGGQLAGLQAAWAAGDRRGALAAIPDEVVDDLVVHGPPEACRERLGQYRANGIKVPVLALAGPPGLDVAAAVRELAPR